ncbi:MAG: hypothetical protein KAJ55_17560 [Anaerolineales bacterium]|nr:hypothetical protein [Anaerolineales bacterium]
MNLLYVLIKIEKGDFNMGFLKNMFSVGSDDVVTLQEPFLTLGGHTGLLKLYDDKVVIDRSDFKPVFVKHLKKENVILLNNVLEIHLKSATRFLNGYIRFVLIGGDGSNLSVLKVGKDDNAVITTVGNNEFMLRFVDKILEINPSILVLERDNNSELDSEVFVNKLLKTVSLGVAHVGEEMLKAKIGARYKGTMAQREMLSINKSSTEKRSSSQRVLYKEDSVCESVQIQSDAEICIDIGNSFETHVVDLFDKSYFTVVEWTTDMMRKHNRYVESDSNPDLTMRHKTTNMVFNVECKFRSKLYKGGLSWSNWNQLQRYKSYTSDNKIPLFVVIGLGGSPQYPDRMFCIPIDDIEYPTLYPSVFEKYERDSGKMFFCDGVILK